MATTDNFQMNPRLSALPASLTSALGLCNRQEQLVKGLAGLPQPVLNLLQTRVGKPYTVRVLPYGLDLMLQCVNPDADEQSRLWGLHSITLHTAQSEASNFWPYDWPEGLDPIHNKALDMVEIFQPEEESAVITPMMTCFNVGGAQEQTWAMICMFDSETERLETLTLVRRGDWVI